MFKYPDPGGAKRRSRWVPALLREKTGGCMWCFTGHVKRSGWAPS